MEGNFCLKMFTYKEKLYVRLGTDGYFKDIYIVSLYPFASISTDVIFYSQSKQQYYYFNVNTIMIISFLQACDKPTRQVLTENYCFSSFFLTPTRSHSPTFHLFPPSSCIFFSHSPVFQLVLSLSELQIFLSLAQCLPLSSDNFPLSYLLNLQSPSPINFYFSLPHQAFFNIFPSSVLMLWRMIPWSLTYYLSIFLLFVIFYFHVLFPHILFSFRSVLSKISRATPIFFLLYQNFSVSPLLSLTNFRQSTWPYQQLRFQTFFYFVDSSTTPAFSHQLILFLSSFPKVLSYLHFAVCQISCEEYLLSSSKNLNNTNLLFLKYRIQLTVNSMIFCSKEKEIKFIWSQIIE